MYPIRCAERGHREPYPSYPRAYLVGAFRDRRQRLQEEATHRTHPLWVFPWAPIPVVPDRRITQHCAIQASPAVLPL